MEAAIPLLETTNNNNNNTNSNNNDNRDEKKEKTRTKITRLAFDDYDDNGDDGDDGDETDDEQEDDELSKKEAEIKKENELKQAEAEKSLQAHAIERRDQWMSLARACHIQCKATVMGDLDMDRLMTTYDMTEEGLKRLFRLIDSDNSGSIVTSEFKQGLSYLHLDISDDKQFDELFHKFASKGSETVDFEEFSEAMIYLSLAALFNQPKQAISKACASKFQSSEVDSNLHDANLRVLDWNESYTHEHTGLDNVELNQLFFFGHRRLEFQKRWIILNYPDPETILKLSVKYRFHPVATEDLIGLESQSAMIKEYSPHNFFILPCVYLLPPIGSDLIQTHQNKAEKRISFSSNPSQKKSQTLTQAWLKEFEKLKTKCSKYSILSERIVCANISVFVAGPPKYDTVITVQSKLKKLFSSLRSTHQSSSSSPSSSSSSSSSSQIDNNIKQQEQQQKYEEECDFGDESIVVDILNKIASPHGSAVRSGKSDWVFYHILDMIVDRYIPVVTIYTLLLEWIQDDLHAKADSTCYADIRSLVIIKKDLLILRGVIRPIVSIVRHVMAHPNFSKHTKTFTRDIEDNLNMILENIQNNSDWCDSLTEQYRYYRDERMNTTLSTLTIMTGMFIPGQFMTGVFGMNFSNDEGIMTDPTLRNPNGITIFWSLVVICTAIALIFVLFLRYHRSNPEKAERRFHFKHLSPIYWWQKKISKNNSQKTN